MLDGPDSIDEAFPDSKLDGPLLTLRQCRSTDLFSNRLDFGWTNVSLLCAAIIRLFSFNKNLLGIVLCVFDVFGMECVDLGKLLLQYTGDPRRIGEQSRDDITNADSLDICRL